MRYLVADTIEPIAVAAFLLVLGLGLLRGRANLARGFGRYNYRWAKALWPRWVAPRADPDTYLPLVTAFAGAATLLGLFIGVIACAQMYELLRALLLGAGAATFPTSHHCEASVFQLFLIVSTVLFLLGSYTAFNPVWMAAVVQWYWDADLPLDTPFPERARVVLVEPPTGRWLQTARRFAVGAWCWGFWFLAASLWCLYWSR